MHIPLFDLFLRGCVDWEWYEHLPIMQHMDRRDELEKEIEVKEQKIRQVKSIMDTLRADIRSNYGEIERCTNRIERSLKRLGERVNSR